jgi:hypothetical protein
MEGCPIHRKLKKTEELDKGEDWTPQEEIEGEDMTEESFRSSETGLGWIVTLDFCRPN